MNLYFRLGDRVAVTIPNRRTPLIGHITGATLADGTATYQVQPENKPNRPAVTATADMMSHCPTISHLPGEHVTATVDGAEVECVVVLADIIDGRDAYTIRPVGDRWHPGVTVAGANLSPVKQGAK